MNIIDLLSKLITITGNKTVDGILLAIIGVISFSVAFDVVGFIYRLVKTPDREAMSKLHWWVRGLVFLGLSAALIAIVKFLAWFLSSIWWIITLVLIVLAIAIYITIVVLRERKKESSKSDAPQVSEEAKEDVSDGEKGCPVCGGKLVLREGPYGTFWGCENFLKTGCRYKKKK